MYTVQYAPMQHGMWSDCSCSYVCMSRRGRSRKKGIRLRHATRLTQSIPGFCPVARVQCDTYGDSEDGDGEGDDAAGGDGDANGVQGRAWFLG